MRKKVLCVIDMQNDFISGSLKNPEAERIIPAVRDVILNGEWTNIIFTRDTHSKNYLNTQEGQNLPVEHCIIKSDGWQLVDEIQKAIDECASKGTLISKAINKVSFGSMEWRDRIGREVDEIYLCGVCTDICVIANAVIIKTMYPEVPIYVYKNACAGVNPESNDAALTVMRSLQIGVIE